MNWLIANIILTAINLSFAISILINQRRLLRLAREEALMAEAIERLGKATTQAEIQAALGLLPVRLKVRYGII
jgi:hypothetical protein